MPKCAADVRREAQDAFDLMHEALGDLLPPGALPAREQIDAIYGPTFAGQAQAIVEAVAKALRRPPSVSTNLSGRVPAEQGGKRLAEEERALRAAICPVCGEKARDSHSDGGFANGMLVGSGYRLSRCRNGHNWESKGWGEPFVVIAPEPGEVVVSTRDDG